MNAKAPKVSDCMSAIEYAIEPQAMFQGEGSPLQWSTVARNTLTCSQVTRK
ncbi:MAG: hypothetical protein H7Z43_05560 [Clostridia bacterium]|nr:hypothetical protein [Deltaproteobacteria bacterium]